MLRSRFSGARQASHEYACTPHPSAAIHLPLQMRSGAQRAVYEAVLDVHRTCLEVCRPGATLRQLHHISVRLLSDAIAQVRGCALWG